MDRSTEFLLEAIRIERELAEKQARRRAVSLAALIDRCCRVSFLGRLLAALNRSATTATGAPR